MNPAVNRARVIVLSAVLAAGVGWSGLNLLERRVDARVLELCDRLAGPEPRSGGDMFGVLHARVVAVDAYLQQKAGRVSSIGAPCTWGPEQRRDLERDLASLGSFFEQVDGVLDDPQAKWVLGHEGYFPEAPILGMSRRRTDVLCARALVDFDRADGSRDGARRLGQALDMIRLGDDGQSFGYLVSAAEEDIVLGALHLVLEQGRADAQTIREELGARLERISRADRVEIVLSGDIVGAMNYLDVRETRSAVYPWSRLESCIERSRLADGIEESLRLAGANGARAWEFLDGSHSPATAAYVQGWFQIAKDSHLFLAQRDLARRALDIAAELKRAETVRSAPPVDRFSGSPIHEETSDRRVEIRSDGALAALQRKPGQPGSELLCWSIPR
jgi:hypothetical protein